MAKKKVESAEKSYAVGDKLKVSLIDGRIVEATVRAVVEEKLQVDYGHDETALVRRAQIIS